MFPHPSKPGSSPVVYSEEIGYSVEIDIIVEAAMFSSEEFKMLQFEIVSSCVS